MLTEKSCAGQTQGCLRLCSRGNLHLALGWAEGQTHCPGLRAPPDLQGDPEAEKPIRQDKEERSPLLLLILNPDSHS